MSQLQQRTRHDLNIKLGVTSKNKSDFSLKTQGVDETNALTLWVILSGNRTIFIFKTAKGCYFQVVKEVYKLFVW